MSIASLKRLIAKVDTIGSADTQYGVGMPRTSRTTKTKKIFNAVLAHVLSQEDPPGTHRTILEYSEKLIFHDGNDIIILSE